MDKPNETLRERLLAMEQTDATRRESVENQVQAMVERKLSVWQRVGFGLLAGIGILFLISYTERGLWILRPVPEISSSVLGVFWLLGFVSTLAWTVLTAYLVIRGRFHVRTKPFLIAGSGAAMVSVYTVLRTFMSEFALMRYNPQDWRITLGEQLATAMFFMLVLFGLYLILRVVYRMEFRTREKLLEIEYRLADLAEHIKGDAKR